MKVSKLVKYKDTKLEAVQYTQSGSRGKLLVTFGIQQGKTVIRFHKIKNIKLVQQFDFGKQANLDFVFSDHIETTIIELGKSDPKPQLAVKPVLVLKQVLYYAGHIIACYQDSSVVELYKVNGQLVK